jgi:ATP-dependent Clp protease protease subunit
VYERLLDRRIVLVPGHVDAALATEVCARLAAVQEYGDEPIRLHLRTPDADLEAAFALIDTIDGLTAPVYATAIGEVGGSALGILAAAPHRQATPHASLLLSEPLARIDEGTAGDLAARERHHRRLVEALYARLAEVTGRSAGQIEADARARLLLDAREAVAYGLIQSTTADREPPSG